MIPGADDVGEEEDLLIGEMSRYREKVDISKRDTAIVRLPPSNPTC